MPREVRILTKVGCHLCEMVEAQLRSSTNYGTLIQLVDIDEDKRLSREYWLRIPVVMVDGEVVFEAKMIDLEGRWRADLSKLVEARG